MKPNPTGIPERGWLCTFNRDAAIHNYRWALLNRADAQPLTLYARRCYRAGDLGGFDTFVQWAVCFGVSVDEVRDGHWREVRKAEPENIVPMTIAELESLVPAFPGGNSGHWRFPECHAIGKKS